MNDDGAWLQWSWSYCACMDPAVLCPNMLRCPAHLEWNAISCQCNARYDINGNIISADAFETVPLGSFCQKRAACAYESEVFNEETCECQAPTNELPLAN